MSGSPNRHPVRVSACYAKSAEESSAETFPRRAFQNCVYATPHPEDEQRHQTGAACAGADVRAGSATDGAAIEPWSDAVECRCRRRWQITRLGLARGGQARPMASMLARHPGRARQPPPSSVGGDGIAERMRRADTCRSLHAGSKSIANGVALPAREGSRRSRRPSHLKRMRKILPRTSRRLVDKVAVAASANDALHYLQHPQSCRRKKAHRQPTYIVGCQQASPWIPHA